MSDTIYRAASSDGKIRIFAADTTKLVSEAQRIHHASPTATAALGRLLTASAIMGSMMKGENDRLTLRIKGDGPIGSICAVSDSKAHVKGYCQNPAVDIAPKAPGKLNVGGAVGAGMLAVIYDLGLKEPYSAQTELVSGEIAEDITAYYAISEQVPSAVSLGVLVDRDGKVITAGGFILQLMPQSSDDDAIKLETTIKDLPPVTTMLREGMSCQDIIFRVTEGFDMLIYNDCTVPEYKCDCSKEKVDRALVSLGQTELCRIIREDGKAQITCQFCDRVYDFDKEELRELVKKCK